MTIYYSDLTKAFYNTDVGYTTLPDDIIEITKELHNELLNDINTHGKEIYVVDGEINTRMKPIIITWDIIRSQRNRLLTGSDYTQMPDYPGDSDVWATYRQTLRDIPQSFETPEDVVWPTPPGA
jgi:hypothetical protein